MKTAVLILAIIVLSIGGVSAQDATPEPICAPADYQALATRLLPLVQNLTDPAADSQAALESIHTAATALMTKCAGLSFSSQQDGIQPLIGPVEIPAGLYRATAATDGAFIAHITAIDGECGAGTGDNLSEYLFNAMPGQAVGGTGAVFTSNGCQALIEISNISKPPWTLDFEKLR